MTHLPSEIITLMLHGTLLPNHDLVLDIWQTVMQEARAAGPQEFSILIAPSQNFGSDLIAPLNISKPPVQEVTNLLYAVKSSHMLADPCIWLAVAAPCFIQPSEVMQETTVGDLRQQYVDGDESIREAVAVFIATQGLPHRVNPRVTFRVYIQPVLDPLSTKPVPIEDGHMPGALLAGLRYANQP